MRNSFTLDCRDKLTLEDGSTCVFMKNTAFRHLPCFNLYDSSGVLVVKCRMIGKLFSHLSFTDARGRELATIRFKWALPVLHLPDGSKVELNFFRHMGADFLPKASVELFGSTINSSDGVFSFCEDMEADKQGLINAILCFCRQYPEVRKRDFERVARDFQLLEVALVVILLCYVLFKM